MSTTLRQSWLKILRRFGVRSFKTTSGLGHPFICHVGDFAGEAPFYGSDTDRSELTLMAAWCSGQTRPVIYDVGANLGFVATQLAQMLHNRQPVVVAFEPVWSTFAKLRYSVKVLGLEGCVIPVCCAISDRAGFSSVAFDDAQSLFAQVRPDTLNARVGRKSNWVATQTIDTAVEGLALTPTLLKVDVEGFEAHVFRGAERLLSGPDAPAIMFELNPMTLREVGSSVSAIATALFGYEFIYVGDFEGQLRPFGARVQDIRELEHVCNVFAVPANDAAAERWQRCVGSLTASQVRSTQLPLGRNLSLPSASRLR